jgi:hypothetical protein
MADEYAHPAWCEEHDDFAWLYDDGSGSCFYTCIVESGGSDCRLKPRRRIPDRRLEHGAFGDEED